MQQDPELRAAAADRLEQAVRLRVEAELSPERRQQLLVQHLDCERLSARGAAALVAARSSITDEASVAVT